MILPSLSSFSPPGPVLPAEVIRSRFAGGCEELPLAGAVPPMLLRWRAERPGVVALPPLPPLLVDPGEGKKRLGGAQAGKWSSTLDGRKDSAENAERPLGPPKANSWSSLIGVPGMELPGVEKGEFAEYTEGVE